MFRWFRRAPLLSLPLLVTSCGSPSVHSVVPTTAVPVSTAVPQRVHPPQSVAASGATDSSVPAAELDSQSPVEAAHPALNHQTKAEDSQVVVTTEPVEVEGIRERPAGSVAGAVADEQLQTWNVGGRSDPSHVSNRNGYHPGTRVRVDVMPGRRSKKGHTIANRVQAGLRNRGYWSLRNCYEDVARVQPDPGGKTWLRITLSSRGAVQSARVLRTELLHRSIAGCHAAALRQLRLEPIGIRRFDADVEVSVWPGDVPLMPLPKSIGKRAAVDTKALSALVDTLDAAVSECMKNARANDPNLWGRLALSFAVDERGRPTQIREFQSQFGDALAIACVSEQLAALEVGIPVSRDVRVVAAWRLHRPELPLAPQPSVTSEQPVPSNDSDAPELSPNSK